MKYSKLFIDNTQQTTPMVELIGTDGGPGRAEIPLQERPCNIKQFCIT
ncbi:MAG: hypothetical protein PHO08_03110 [Methylococcales bacterium]|nr:hypothetical protein [Methylococcales bacterium]MDD5633406.1 hypothetical protein [Methylococcales bacterium]